MQLADHRPFSACRKRFALHIYNYIFTPLELILTQNHQVGCLVLLSDEAPNSHLGALLSCRMIYSRAIDFADINVFLTVKYGRSSDYHAHGDLEPYVPLAARIGLQKAQLTFQGPLFTIISGSIEGDAFKLSDLSARSLHTRQVPREIDVADSLRLKIMP